MYSVDQNRVAEIARRAGFLTWFLFLAIPALALWYWIDPLAFPLATNGAVQRLAQAGDLTMNKRFGGFFVTMLPVSAFMFTLFQINILLNSFAAGCFINENTIAAMRRAGKSLLLYALLVFLHRTAVTLLVTIDLEAGERLLNISLDPADLFALLLGLLLVVLSGVFRIEKSRAEDDALII